MKRTYTSAQIAHKKTMRAARQNKKTRKTSSHPTVGNKIYSCLIVSPIQCLDGVNQVLAEFKDCTIKKFGDDHIWVHNIDEKNTKDLATQIAKCSVTNEKGRTFKVLFTSRKYKDVTPKEEKQKKPSKNTIEVKLNAKHSRKFSNVARNTNRNTVKPPRRVKKLISLIERRRLCKAA